MDSKRFSDIWELVCVVDRESMERPSCNKEKDNNTP
jgi:hypothetical protein